MPQRRSFRFSPKLPASPFVRGRPMLTRPKHPAHSLACLVLNETYVDLSRDQPPLTIDLPRSDLARYQARIIPAGGDALGLLYSDHSVLVGREVEGSDGTLIRLLPIILKLGQSLTTAVGAIRIEVVATSSRPTVHLTASRVPTDLFRDKDPVNTAVRERLLTEIAAWAEETRQMPVLQPMMPGIPIEGRLGLERPAPNPKLVGRRYAWSAALPGTNETRETIDDVRRFLYLAWVRTTMSFPETLASDNVRIDFRAGQPNQSDNKAITKLETGSYKFNMPNFSAARQDACLRYYERLLYHHTAPKALDTVISTEWQPSSGLKTALLFSSRKAEAPSAHDRLAAMALFEDFQDPA